MANRSFAGLGLGGWRDLAFEPFRDGVAVHWLERGGPDAPSLAVLRYAPGASVPRHRHRGLETILVLDGMQSDENGDYGAGAVVINPAGSEHSVRSAAGCAVLIQWTLPVEIIEDSR
ncbi:cupin domain-containing protein [Inquilinus limosus]|uniref:cupin domain-containing protein n=1 Tax=Inquilinus limosus TaxID=171674 RepID=UPI003F177C7A